MRVRRASQGARGVRGLRGRPGPVRVFALARAADASYPIQGDALRLDRLRPSSSQDSTTVQVDERLLGRHDGGRRRPKSEDWKLSFEIELLEEDLDPEVVKAILTSAGHKVGIGNNRLNGFGRFEVTRWKPR